MAGYLVIFLLFLIIRNILCLTVILEQQSNAFPLCVVQVGQVSAWDADEGTNGQVSYMVISDWGNDVFSLNPQTGVFTLTSRLDYEQVSTHSPCYLLSLSLWHPDTTLEGS